MVQLDLNELIYIHKAISDLNIKGAEAPFVTNILTKLATEANQIANEKETKNQPNK